MGGMPATIAKGSVQRKIDKICNSAECKRFLDALKDWNGKPDYVQILEDLAGVTPEEAKHLRRTWFDPDHGWWLEYQPIEFAMRQSLIKTIELAHHDPTMKKDRTSPLYIDSYWICASSHFEVFVTCSDHQVTRIVLTPGMPEGHRSLRVTGKEENIWIIKAGTPGEKIEDTVEVKKGDKSYAVDIRRLKEAR